MNFLDCPGNWGPTFYDPHNIDNCSKSDLDLKNEFSLVKMKKKIPPIRNSSQKPGSIRVTELKFQLMKQNDCDITICTYKNKEPLSSRLLQFTNHIFSTPLVTQICIHIHKNKN